jgi:hypothetical protein
MTAIALTSAASLETIALRHNRYIHQLLKGLATAMTGSTQCKIQRLLTREGISAHQAKVADGEIKY